ncbi:MAG: hypothetical protein BEN18_06460 [Epulopiscium sp. Nuni2H_MBin001]|nr:MAG: hypothetical protein BEN18_06460 [Epulopiscium sp. Nuni2H_MBin001]
MDISLIRDNWVLFILATCAHLAFSFLTLITVSQLITNYSKGIFICIAFSIINCCAYSSIYFLNIPHYFYYSIAFICLCVECVIMGTTKREAGCIASYVTLNMSTAFLALVKIYTYLYNFQTDIISDRLDINLIVSFTLYIILIIVSIVTIKLLGIKNIKNIITTEGYAELLTVLGALLTLQIGFDEFIILFNYDFGEQAIMIFSTVLVNYILYYTVLYHTYQSIGINLYRQKTDEAKLFYSQLLNRRNEIVNKVTRDDLTQLYTKMYIVNHIKATFTECIKDKATHGIIFIDINGLKYVNDNYGHEAGDRLIKRVAHAVKGSIRENEKDLAGRLGGDELLLFLNQITASELDSVVRKIRENIRIQNDIEDFLVAASIGELIVTPELAALGLEYILEEVDVIMRKDKAKFYSEMEDKL